ncbi:MAG: hypothetical protein M3P27_06280 [Acidobacteriota bacterium]|nr:hypothetical protein [Acidobacteriota bacterium]
MKKTKDPDMQPEYDFSGGVRGKYVGKIDWNAPVIITGRKAGGPKRGAQAARLQRNGKKRKRA